MRKRGNKLKIAALTQKGTDKKENEDRIIIGKTILVNGIYSYNGDVNIIAIADGVGGNNAGAVASHYVANCIGELSVADKEKFSNINNRLIDMSKKDITLNNMATTLSGIFFEGNIVKTFHIGNTRVYLLQGERYLKQITQDDTTLNYLVKTGQIAKDEANTFQQKNEINACFGGGDTALFNMKIAILSDSSVATFLLTSDGIHECVSIDELEDIFKTSETDIEICEKIANNAVAYGSSDDLSVLVVRIK